MILNREKIEHCGNCGNCGAPEAREREREREPCKLIPKARGVVIHCVSISNGKLVFIPDILTRFTKLAD